MKKHRQTSISINGTFSDCVYVSDAKELDFILYMISFLAILFLCNFACYRFIGHSCCPLFSSFICRQKKIVCIAMGYCLCSPKTISKTKAPFPFAHELLYLKTVLMMGYYSHWIVFVQVLLLLLPPPFWFRFMFYRKNIITIIH